MLALVRLTAVLAPAWDCAHTLRRLLGPRDRAGAAIAEIVLALAVLLLAAELTGLGGLLGAPALIAALCAAAMSARLGARRRGTRRHGSGIPARAAGANGADATPRAAGANGADATPRAAGALGAAGAAQTDGADGAAGAEATAGAALSPAARRATLGAALVAVAAVAAQWTAQTANSLGSGMTSFDTLWYHMPFAARFAESGSVTALQFTQADPFVAYYPANAELLHAVGIVAMHGDVLSPLMNLGWAALALLAGWRIGRPWGVQPGTLLASATLLSLPVLSDTQPGEAFNDVAGLACLLAAIALAVEARPDRRTMFTAGLALGLAAGTKLNFLVPVAGLLAGFAAVAPRGRRGEVLLATAAGTALTCGWWYLRNLLLVGNPLGLSMHLGPLRLPGPGSPLAESLQETVASQLGHTALWSSRFAPGLAHALGLLWPLLLLLALAGATVPLLVRGRRDGRLAVLGAVAWLSALVYLLLPTGASDIAHQTTLFEVNLRYLTPALAPALVLLPLLAAVHGRRAHLPLVAALLAIVLVAQGERSLWPAQPARHLAFAAACLALLGLCLRVVPVLRARPVLRAPVAAALTGLGLGAGFLIQHHYYSRRYLLGDATNPALGAIDKWAQGLSHTRLALYGAVVQYPLYGARDTNTVDYIGRHTGAGGYAPIASCRRWRATLAGGRYSFLVLSPGPTAAIPLSWTTGDGAAVALSNPGAGYYVFRLTGAPPRPC